MRRLVLLLALKAAALLASVASAQDLHLNSTRKAPNGRIVTKGYGVYLGNRIAVTCDHGWDGTIWATPTLAQTRGRHTRDKWIRATTLRRYGNDVRFIRLQMAPPIPAARLGQKLPASLRTWFGSGRVSQVRGGEFHWSRRSIQGYSGSGLYGADGRLYGLISSSDLQTFSVASTIPVTTQGAT